MSPPAIHPVRARLPGVFWPAVALLILASGCGRAEEGGRAGAGGSGSTRHVILISLDTLRPDHLSCYGHPRKTSPTLDALAQRGTRFTDVTAAAPWTLPSHATLLTGLYPSHHGVKSHTTRLAESIRTLAEDFQAGGFETLAVVNTHNLGAPQFGLGRGFGRFEYITETDEDPSTGRVRTLNMGEVVVSSARDLLSARDPAKPFFLFLHFYDAHTDFTPAPEFRREFVGDYQGKLDGRTQQLNGVRNRGAHLNEADLRFLREMYEAEIRTLDALLGRFFAWLDAQGLLQDTLLVVTSDHGEEFQEHGSVLHGRTQYQELLRVPLILAGPGVPVGEVIEIPVHGVDVAPTLLGLTGLDSPVRHDGLDLSGLFRGGDPTPRVLYAEADQDNRGSADDQLDTKRMIRRGMDKLILDRLTGRAELYDLGADPGEQHERSREDPDLARDLAAGLARFLAGAVVPVSIPMPTPDEQRKLDALGYGGGDDDDDGEK